MPEEIIKNDFEEEELEQDQYLVFKVHSQEFGFQAIKVLEISSVLSVREVPNTPEYIEGITNLRGRLVTVINFRKKFGFDEKENDEDTRIVILESGHFPIGIIVDSAEEVIKIPDETVQEVPESTSVRGAKDYMTGIGVLDNRLIILFDPDKILSETELIEKGEMSRVIDEAKEELKTVESKKES